MLRDPAIEKSLLYTVVHNPDKFIDTFMEQATQDCFTDVLALRIWKFLAKCYKNNKPISSVRLMQELSKDEGRDWVDLYAQWEDTFIIEGEFDTLLEQAVSMTRRRRIMDAVSKASDLVHNDELGIEELSSRTQELIFAATIEGFKAKHEYKLCDLLDEWYGEFLDIQGGKLPDKGIPTGYPKLDLYLQGLQRKNLILIAARTTVGKSALGLNICNNIMRYSRNCKILVVTLEMSAQQMVDRIVKQNALVPASRYNNRLSDSEVKNINLAVDKLYNKELHFIDERGISAQEIKAKVRKKYRELGGLDLVVIDYLQMIKLPKDSYSLSRAIGDIDVELRNLAGELDVPIILASQLSRSRDGRHGAAPDLSELRDSGMTEEVADAVLLIHRDTRDNKPQVPCKVIVAKNRTGYTGIVDMVWYRDYIYYRDAHLEDKEGPLVLERSG